jgi:hypothetical protein
MGSLFQFPPLKCRGLDFFSFPTKKNTTRTVVNFDSTNKQADQKAEKTKGWS